MASLSEATAHLEQQAQRGRNYNEYNLDGLRYCPETYKSIGVIQLSNSDQIQALARCSAEHGDNTLMAGQELTKQAIYMINGKRVNFTERERFWESCGPVVQALVSKAYSKLNAPNTDEDSLFFESQTTKVG